MVSIFSDTDWAAFQASIEYVKMDAIIFSSNIIKLCYTNQDLCRIPGHATQAKAALSGTQVYLTNPAEAWVACPGILHRS